MSDFGTRPFPPTLGTLEAEAMNELWRQGEATVRSVREALNTATAQPRAYTTVLTVMHRLSRKGLTVRRRDGRADVYTARLSHDEYREACVQAETDALVEQYGQSALVAFARELERIGPERRRVI